MGDFEVAISGGFWVATGGHARPVATEQTCPRANLKGWIARLNRGRSRQVDAISNARIAVRSRYRTAVTKNASKNSVRRRAQGHRIGTRSRAATRQFGGRIHKKTSKGITL